MLSREGYDEVISLFPSMNFAFAYGSGAVAQAGYDYGVADINSLPMIDMIFVVNDSQVWHQANLLRNPSHYTPMFPIKHLPVSVMRSITDDYGAGVWFNVDVPIRVQGKTRKIKYGVISEHTLLQDLEQWKYMYIAGRLHKPVLQLIPNTRIEAAMRKNLDSALVASLLLLPSSFQELELFRTIASLSYSGDPRMGIAENPNKIDNLVGPKLPEFRSLYAGSFSALSSAQFDKGGGLTQDCSDNERSRLFALLPTQFQEKCLKGQQQYSKAPSGQQIAAALSGIVRRVSSSQSVKGVITAGFASSGVYLLNKIKKAFIKK